MADKHYKVLIKLEESLFARSYSRGECVHQEEMERAERLLEEQLKKAKTVGKSVDEEATYLVHLYNTISIFGGRGTGKSSFLYSLMEDFHEKHKEDIAMLPVIDPTMIEEREHVFLLVVSLINDAVNKHLTERELAVNTDAYSRRKEWHCSLQQLAFGLPSLENVGKNYATDNWEDDGYIMRTGLRNVSAAFNLERSFHLLIDKALKILGKKAFMLAFDDIDVDMKKGWPVLETLRKYLTSPKLLILLSGNYRLYSNNVRLHQWEQLERLKQLEPGDKYRQQVDELEGQYLLKIFKAQNRIHLHTLQEMLNWGSVTIEVLSGGQAKSIKDIYKHRLEALGAYGLIGQELFVRFLLSLSVRSQIQFLGNTDGIEAFASKMYAHNINIDTATQFSNMLGVVAAKYLLEQNALKDCHLLLPTTEDETTNSCLMGLSVLYSKHMASEPYVAFDYMLRLAYLRNVMMPLIGAEDLNQLAKYNSMRQDVSLNTMIGLTMAFLEEKQSMNEHIRLYGLGKKAKNSDTDRIDQVFEQTADDGVRTIGYLPLVALTSSAKNDSKVYYSMFMLLAAIARVLKCENSIEAISNELAVMATIRSYAMPAVNKVVTTSEDDEEEYLGEDANGKKPDKLAAAIIAWRKKYPFAGKGLMPYLLGSIVNRFFSAVKNISEEYLSQQMHLSVACFFNACLVEEAQELGVAKVNYNNSTNTTKIFEDNLQNLKGNTLPFTSWIMQCPLLTSFLGQELRTKLPKTDIAPFDVYDCLKNVKHMSSASPFRSTMEYVDAMVKAFESHNFDYKKEVIDCDDIKNAVESLKDAKIFTSNVTEKSIDKFKKNYEQKYGSPK